MSAVALEGCNLCQSVVEGIEAVFDPSVAAVEPVGKRTDKENPMVAAATVVAEIVDIFFI